MDRHLLAVMPDTESAQHLARVLVDEGIGPDAIRVDDAADEPDALRAEMAAETTDSIVAPQAVFIASKEGTRGSTLVAAVASVIAIVIAALVALIDVGLTYWARFAIDAGWLVFMAVMLGYMLGAAWAWNPDDTLAAERGVVVRVADASPRIADIIIENGPIRVDEVSADGGPLADVHHEGSDADQHLGAKVADTVGRIQRSVENESQADPTDNGN